MATARRADRRRDPWGVAALVLLLSGHGASAAAAPAHATALAHATAPAPTPTMDAGHGPGSEITAPWQWPEGPKSPRNASYTMQARWDPDTHLIEGHEILRFTNITERPTSELRYHLYYNAWRNDRSSWLRRAAEQGRRFDHVARQDWAYVDVHALELLDEHGGVAADLRPTARYIAPDDGNLDDRTVLQVPLPRPLAPGQTIEVRLRFTSKVPRTFARTGVRGDYLLAAQWFPKLGVLRDDGTWACHQFIQTEFFSDFGVYDVSIDAPSDWVVGATGREQETTSQGDRTIHRFVQEDVHDFAFTASPHFTVHTRRFESPGLPAVDMRLLLMPDHAAHRDGYLDATAATLEHYGRWWGPYPYGHITIVDPAYGSDTGGMEYPTLFTGGTHWLAPALSRSPEGVTVHEAGHQFWYGMVANDEFEHAWLDEGFNTYSATRTMEAAFPEHAHVERYLEGLFPVVLPSVVPHERTAGADKHVGMASALKRDPQSRPSWQTGPGGYRVNAYDKGALTLRTLEGYLGWPTFQRVMTTYLRSYAFAHPRPQDFFAVAERVSGQRLGWFFSQVWGDSVTFDYAVGEVTSWRDGPLRGYSEQGADDPAAASSDDEDAAGSGPDEAAGPGEATLHHSVVTVRRWGEGRFPVEVEVSFSDGARIIEHWDGQDRWQTYRYQRPGQVERVRVDPSHVLVLDTEFSNNAWLRQAPAELAATKWASHWMLWVQHTMEGLAFFS